MCFYSCDIRIFACHEHYSNHFLLFPFYCIIFVCVCFFSSSLFCFSFFICLSVYRSLVRASHAIFIASIFFNPLRFVNFTEAYKKRCTFDVILISTCHNQTIAFAVAVFFFVPCCLFAFFS